MTKKTLLIFIVCVVVAYIPIRLIIPTKELSYVAPYVLFLTLLAILWYSWETSQLRIQQKDIMELSLKPHLIFFFRRGGFYLYNIGNGPAVNIRIDDTIVPLPDLPTVRLRFSKPAIIKKDDYLPINIRIMTEDGEREASGFHLGFLMVPTATLTIDVFVHFENLMGKKYEYKLRVGKDMPSEFDPIDLILHFLMGTPKSIASSNYLGVLYENPIERMRLLQYCREKGFIEATPIETEQEGIVEFRNIRITSKGIDYIKGTS